MILPGMAALSESSLICDLVAMPHFTIKISQEIHFKVFAVIADIPLNVCEVLLKKLQKIVVYK